MMNMLKKSSSRSKGQAMVEFALVFPILMVVVVGMIEAGRLLFIYGSSVTASRQAVRYGSATGDNGDGTGTRKYLDCAGIQAAAEQMGFLAAIDEVVIKYYDGDTGNEIHDCTSGDPNAGMFKNGDRVEVTTTTNYSPMLSFIPFSDFPITSSSRRTIFIGITIEAKSDGSGGSGTTGGYEFTKSASPTTYLGAGETIKYSFEIVNTGSSAFSFTIEDPKVGSINCGGQSTLAIGGSLTCTASYETTDADVVEGDLINVAKVTATFDDDGSTNIQQDSVTVTYVEQAIITLAKSATPNVANVGDTINYSYTITNIGTPDLDTFSLNDDQLGAISCPSATITNGQSVVCTKAYTVTQADVDAGSIYNLATATAGNTTGLVSDPVTAEFTVITKPLSLTFSSIQHPSGTPEYANDILEYRFVLTNNTDEAMTSPTMTLSINRQDNTPVTVQPNTISCLDTTLNANGQTTCVGYYELEQEDLDAGGLKLENAVANAIQSGSTLTSNEVALSKVNTAIVPDMELSLEVSLTNGGANILNKANPPVLNELTDTKLYYTYTIENTGNVTLDGTDFWIYDISETVNEAVVCSNGNTFSNLAPDGTTTCTFEYGLQEEDWMRGSIIGTEVAYTDYVTWDGSVIPTTSDPAFTHTIYTHNGARLEISEMSAQIIFADGSASVTIQSNNSPAQPVRAGDQITLSYKLLNTGNIDLSQDFSITDYAGTTSCNTNISTLVPGEESLACTRDGLNIYTVSGNEPTEFNFTASASANSNTVTSEPPNPTIYLSLPQPCSGFAWRSDALYTTGYVVSYNGYDWTSDSIQFNNVPGANPTTPWPDADKTACIGVPDIPHCTATTLWDTEARYKTGDKVVYADATWIALKNANKNTAAPNVDHSAWAYSGDCNVFCTAPTWNSTILYQSPDVVTYCSNGTCAEWVNLYATATQNIVPGTVISGLPPVWVQRNACIVQ